MIFTILIGIICVLAVLDDKKPIPNSRDLIVETELLTDEEVTTKFNL